MIIALLLQVMGGMGRLGGGSFMLGFGWGTRSGYDIFSISSFSVFVLLLIVLSLLVYDSLLRV